MLGRAVFRIVVLLAGIAGTVAMGVGASDAGPGHSVIGASALPIRAVLPLVGTDSVAAATHPVLGTEIGRVQTGDTSARTAVDAHEARAVGLMLSNGDAAYVPGDGLDRAATVELRTIALPTVPAAYEGVRALALDFGGAQPTRGVLVEMAGTPGMVMLHQAADTGWEEIPVVATGGKVHGLATSASPFVLARKKTPPPLKTLKGECFAVGFTGWRVDPTGTAPFWVDTPDVLEWLTPGLTLLINANSGVKRLLDDAQLESHMWRHYEYGFAYLAAKQQAAEGRRIVLVGHSAGGAAALLVASMLEGDGIPVQLYVGLDTFTGARDDMPTWVKRISQAAPPWVTRYPGKVPTNVLRVFNAYQQTSFYYHGARAEVSSPTRIVGEVEALDTEHGAVPDAARKSSLLKNAIEEACQSATPTPTPTPTATPTPTRTPSPTPTPKTPAGNGGAPTIYSLGCQPKVADVNEQVICLSDGTGTVTSLTWSAPGGTPNADSSYSIWFATRYGSSGQKTITLTACNYAACTSRSEVITVGSSGPSCSVPSAPNIHWAYPAGNFAAFQWFWSSQPAEGSCAPTHYELVYNNATHVTTNSYLYAPNANPACITVVAINAAGRSQSSTRCYGPT